MSSDVDFTTTKNAEALVKAITSVTFDISSGTPFVSQQAFLDFKQNLSKQFPSGLEDRPILSDTEQSAYNELTKNVVIDPPLSENLSGLKQAVVSADVDPIYDLHKGDAAFDTVYEMLTEWSNYQAGADANMTIIHTCINTVFTGTNTFSSQIESLLQMKEVKTNHTNPILGIVTSLTESLTFALEPELGPAAGVPALALGIIGTSISGSGGQESTGTSSNEMFMQFSELAEQLGNIFDNAYHYLNPIRQLIGSNLGLQKAFSKMDLKNSDLVSPSKKKLEKVIWKTLLKARFICCLDSKKVYENDHNWGKQEKSGRVGADTAMKWFSQLQQQQNELMAKAHSTKPLDPVTLDVGWTGLEPIVSPHGQKRWIAIRWILCFTDDSGSGYSRIPAPALSKLFDIFDLSHLVDFVTDGTLPLFISPNMKYLRDHLNTNDDPMDWWKNNSASRVPGREAMLVITTI